MFCRACLRHRTFLIASPMINEVAAVILVGILGWKLAALYIGAGLLVAWVGGVVMERFRPERWVEDYVWKIQVGETSSPEQDTSLAGRHRYALGVLFHGYVLESWVVEHLGVIDNCFAVPAAGRLRQGSHVVSAHLFVIASVARQSHRSASVDWRLPRYARNDGAQGNNEGAGDMMKVIKVLGSGCANCKTTAKLIENVAAEQGIDVRVEKVEDIAEIMGYGVMSTPGVVIDGRVVHAGGVPDRKLVASWL